MKNRRGQVTIFIIIAVVLVAAIVGILIFRNQLTPSLPSAEISPIQTTLLSCLESYTKTGVSVLESQGGYIYLPEFEAGSNYMPFSSQLDFMGNGIPYWYYVSGNNIQKEQVPSKTEMQEQLARYIEEKIRNCRFDSYYEQGFAIKQGEPSAKVTINQENIDISLTMNLGITKGEETSNLKTHNIKLNTNLGRLYDTSKKLYQYEQDSLFLENYGVDILRLYAPVDGIEITCSPKVWAANNIFNDLQNGIESNTQALKTKGGQYTLTKDENKYFITDFSSTENIRFLNSKDWTYSFEVDSEDPILIANPVGNQPGLGILGFCYVPYHFVYNIKYPVLVQVSSGDETFQFPLAVVILGNNPRKPLDATASQIQVPELCKYKNTLVNVKTIDNKMNPINSDISFECFGTKCNIGSTANGILNEQFPQCVNGYILARTEGYREAKYLYSTTKSGEVTIVLNKLYNLNVDLKLDGIKYSNKAIIIFDSDNGAKTISYPEQKSVELSEGQYEITAYIYKDSQLKLESTTTEQCVDVPRQGLGGLFGLTQKKCFDLDIPEQVLSSALAGGGKVSYYALENELVSSRTIELNAKSLPEPKTLEQLQENYILFESKNLDINVN